MTHPAAPLNGLWSPWPTEAAWMLDHTAAPDSPDEIGMRAILAVACRHLADALVAHASAEPDPFESAFRLKMAHLIAELPKLPVAQVRHLARAASLGGV